MENPSLNNADPLLSLLPLRVAVITLRFDQPADLPFFHHFPLNAFIRHLLRSPEQFGHCLITEPLENGHTRYRAGDAYRWRLTALNGAEDLLEGLFTALENLPASAAHIDPDVALGQNLRLAECRDGPTGKPVCRWQQLTAVGPPSIWDQAGVWADTTRFRWRTTTPMRLQRQHKQPHSARFIHNRADLDWPVLQQRLFDTLINAVKHHTHVRHARPDLQPGRLEKTLCTWLHFGYTDARGRHKPVGGLLGAAEIHLAQTLPDWVWFALVVGQYIGIGQHRTFGMGQYQLLTADGEAPYPRPAAAWSLLTAALGRDNLERAWRAMQDRPVDREDAEDDGIDAGASDPLEFDRLGELAEKLEHGAYRVPDLIPATIDRPEGGQRQLSIPPWRDRALQKAVAQWLTPALDHLYSEHSYGYRRGRSRLNARDAINRAIQQGYDWVLESDVEGVFDSVQWSNLEQRLQLLLPNEPLVSRLMAWVRADRLDADGEPEPRRQGLPQGAPISPMLANLLLDDLDQDMRARGYHMIRYADDFVLLFKSQAAAEAALEPVRQSLQEHGLSLNPDKTRVVASRQGFRYLGYLFIDGYAIEASREDPPVSHRALAPEPDSPAADTGDVIGERLNLGTLLVVAGELALLCSEQGRLVVEQHEQRCSYPWQSLEAVLLIGPHQITTPALRAAMGHGVAIHFASQFGRYQGVACGADPSPLGTDFWLLQRRFLDNADNCLRVAVALVAARAYQIKALIRRRDPHWSALPKFERIQRQIRQAANVETLRGHEGRAAKLLWEFFRGHLPEEWQFSGRNRRPPKDPVNAMLSLGYTYIYSLTDSMIRVVGLHPWQAAYHQQHGQHKTLVSDLMEPFRYLVERAVLTLVNRRQIKPEDFAVTEQGCQMSSEARKTLLVHLLASLTRQQGDQPPLAEEIRKQAWRFALSCRTGQDFAAWRGRESE